MTSARVPARLAATMAAVLLAGCASTAGIESQSKLRTPDSFGLQAGAASQAQAPAAVPTQWWTGFGDAQLDRLVAQALADSPNLKVAQARLARARSVLEVANAATQPQLEASADIKRQRFTENGLYPPPLAGSIRETGTLQLGGSWEIDFFGRYAQALEAALGSSRAAQADVDAARTLLASQVARSYFQLARLNDQLAVAQRTLAQREESLKLVRDRVRAGLDTTLEERQSEGALPETRQQIEALQEQVQLTRNALAALVGQPQLQVEPRLLADARPVALPAPSRPTCWPAGPTSPPRAGASRPPRRTCQRQGAVLSRTSTCRRSSACPASAWAACWIPAASSGAWARHPPADLRRRPPARQPARQARPTSTSRSRATTAPCSTRSTTPPTAGRQPAVHRPPAGRAAQARSRRRRRLRHRRAALPRRPGHLPERADRRNRGAGAAPARRRPRRPRARHARALCAPSAAAPARRRPSPGP
jgi:hypothetical protein